MEPDARRARELREASEALTDAMGEYLLDPTPARRATVARLRRDVAALEQQILSQPELR